jgi:hypothetical protein
MNKADNKASHREIQHGRAEPRTSRADALNARPTLIKKGHDCDEDAYSRNRWLGYRIPAPQQVLQRDQQAPATSVPSGTQFLAILAQKAVLYEDDPANPKGRNFFGWVIWRTESITPNPGRPPELAIRADVEVPERKLAVTWSLGRNTDKGMPATHVVKIIFTVPPDSSGGIYNVPGILMKQALETTGVPLAGLSVKVTPSFYRIGLSNAEADKERNLQLLKERGWFSIPVVYDNNRRAILAIEKGAPGERVFADAFKAWTH